MSAVEVSQQREGIGVVTLNRPEVLNAMDAELINRTPRRSR